MKFNRNWFLIAIAVVLASILLPFMQEGSFAGNVVNSEVVYRDGWFGPYIERVTLDNGGVMYVTQYPWYTFHEQFSELSSMNICGLDGGSAMVGGASSSYIELVAYPDDAPIEIMVRQMNNLDFSSSVNWWEDGKETCTKSRLVMYKGSTEKYTEEWKELSPLVNPWQDLTWSHGPYAYGATWESHVTFDPWYYDGGNQLEFTIVETLYTGPLIGYDTDVGYVDVTMLKRVTYTDPDDPTSPVDPNDPIVIGGVGSIQVKVLDNLIKRSATVDMYKNDNKIQTVFIDGGSYTFDNLEFGTYRFEVIDQDYETWFYDAFPQQSEYDYDIGNVELSAELNTISYVINGDFASTDGSGLDGGDGLLPDYSNTTTGKVLDEIVKTLTGDGDEDGSLSLTQIVGMIAALMASMGLLANVAIIGLPIFIVGILFLLVAAWVKSGDKKTTNYSPGNKSGGRK